MVMTAAAATATAAAAMAEGAAAATAVMVMLEGAAVKTTRPGGSAYTVLRCRPVTKSWKHARA
jgi:hypothetical protein